MVCRRKSKFFIEYAVMLVFSNCQRELSVWEGEVYCSLGKMCLDHEYHVTLERLVVVVLGSVFSSSVDSFLVDVSDFFLPSPISLQSESVSVLHYSMSPVYEQVSL